MKCLNYYLNMKRLNRIFFQGLFTALPIVLTAYIFISVISIMENVLAGLLRSVLPDGFYFPGLGFVVTVGLIFGLGLLLSSFLAKSIFSIIERRLLQIPFIGAIYSPVKDVMNLFSKNKDDGSRSVVFVDINPDLRMLGIVTRENFSDLRLSGPLIDRVAVYIPFSYGMGGYTVLVSRSQLTAVDLPVEKAMSLAITAWVKSGEAEKKI
jgi:uncharacterized membrane protein